MIIKTCTKISTVARVARNFIKLLNKKYRQPDCLPAWLHIVCIWKICYRFLIFGSPVLLFAWQWSISSLVCTIHWWASECFPTITHFSIDVSLSLCVLTFAFDWHCTHAQKSIFNGVIKWQARTHSHAVQRITMRPKLMCKAYRHFKKQWISSSVIIITIESPNLNWISLSISCGRYKDWHLIDFNEHIWLKSLEYHPFTHRPSSVSVKWSGYWCIVPFITFWLDFIGTFAWVKIIQSLE